MLWMVPVLGFSFRSGGVGQDGDIEAMVKQMDNPSWRESALIAGLLVSTMLTAAAASAVTQQGVEVDRISVAEEIRSWQAVDAQHVLLNIGPHERYLVAFGQACHSLPFAGRIGVSSSNEFVYAGFDYITAGSQRCKIKSIVTLESGS